MVSSLSKLRASGRASERATINSQSAANGESYGIIPRYATAAPAKKEVEFTIKERKKPEIKKGLGRKAFLRSKKKTPDVRVQMFEDEVHQGTEEKPRKEVHQAGSSELKQMLLLSSYARCQLFFFAAVCVYCRQLLQKLDVDMTN